MADNPLARSAESNTMQAPTAAFTSITPTSGQSRLSSSSVCFPTERLSHAYIPHSRSSISVGMRSREVSEDGDITNTYFEGTERTEQLSILQKLFFVFDTAPRKGYLDYTETCLLIDCLGVQMEGFEEIEFFHAIDRGRTGHVTFTHFEEVYEDFKTHGRFIEYHSIVKLSCALAAQTGTTPDEVVRAWKKYDNTMQDEMTFAQVAEVLVELGLHHTLQEIEDGFAEFDVDKNGRMNVIEFISMFTYSQKSAEEERFDIWMMELRICVASAAIRETNSKNTAMLSDEQKKEHWLDSLLQWYSVQFSYLLFLYIQLQVFGSLFEISFLKDGDPMPELRVVLLTSDVVFYAYMALTAFIPKEADLHLLYSLKPRVYHYVFSRQFVFDVLIALPADYIKWNQPVFRMNKMLLVFKNQSLFRTCFRSLLGPRWWRIFNAMHTWAIVAHVIACIFHLLCLHAGDEHTFQALTIRAYSTLPVVLQYLQCFSYAVNTMAGLSRGYFPTHDAQLLCSLFTTICGVFTYAVIIAVVASSLAIRSHVAKFEQVLQEVKEIIGHEVNSDRLPQSFMNDVLSYHKHLFRTTSQIHSDEDVLDDLPTQLKVSVDLVTGRNTIGKLQFLKGLDDDDALVYALQQCLTSVVLPPNYVVFQEGDTGAEMFFIRHGRCQVLRAGIVEAEVGPGSIFGEISLIANVRRTATVQTISFCNLLVLRDSKFRVIMDQFPEVYKRIQKRATARIKAMRGFVGRVMSASEIKHLGSSDHIAEKLNERSVSTNWDSSKGKGEEDPPDNVDIDALSDPGGDQEHPFEWIKQLDLSFASSESTQKKRPVTVRGSICMSGDAALSMRRSLRSDRFDTSSTCCSPRAPSICSPSSSNLREAVFSPSVPLPTELTRCSPSLSPHRRKVAASLVQEPVPVPELDPEGDRKIPKHQAKREECLKAPLDLCKSQASYSSGGSRRSHCVTPTSAYAKPDKSALFGVCSPTTQTKVGFSVM